MERRDLERLIHLTSRLRIIEKCGEKLFFFFTLDVCEPVVGDLQNNIRKV